MTASSTGPRRESASAIHANGRPSISPCDVGASSNALARSSCDRSGLAAARGEQRLDQQRQPLIGLAEDHRRLLPVEDVIANRLTAHGIAVGLLHGERFRVETGRHVQLIERALPLPEHAQQLKQEDAQLRISRLGAHLLLQVRERRDGIPALQTLFGDIGEYSWRLGLVTPLVGERHAALRQSVLPLRHVLDFDLVERETHLARESEGSRPSQPCRW